MGVCATLTSEFGLGCVNSCNRGEHGDAPLLLAHAQAICQERCWFLCSVSASCGALCSVGGVNRWLIDIFLEAGLDCQHGAH